MNEHIPARWLVIGALLLLVTPCALVALAGLLPQDTSGEGIAALILPVVIVAQALFLFWYYRKLRRKP